MEIAYYIKSSLVNYEPNISCVVFTKGCNMTCEYCHNKDLVNEDLVEVDEVLNHLRKRVGMLQAVVVSGGEPTLQESLPVFLSQVKAMGYLTKLDTNGSNPKMVKQLIDENLVDFIAMDIKGLPEQYECICGESFDNTKETLKLLRDFGQYELRTTVYPQLSLSDIAELCKHYKEDPFVLQQYRQMDEGMMTAYKDDEVKAIADAYGVLIRNI